MNAKNRALVIVCCVILCLFAFFLYEGISRHNKTLGILLAKEARHIDTIVEDINRFALTPYLIRIKHLEKEHPAIVRAFAQRDRARLLRLTQHEYSILNRENRYFQSFTFFLPDGTVFLRMRDPGRFGDSPRDGDDILGYIRENLQTVAGYDLTESGPVYQIAHPVHSGNRFIGTMELSININQILDAVAKRLESEVSIILHVNRDNRRLFADNDFIRTGDHALLVRNRPAFSHIPRDYNFDRQQQQVKIDGNVFRIHKSAQLKDFAGHGIGHVVVLQDITANLEKKGDFITRSVTVALLLLGVVFAVIWTIMGGLVKRLENYARENREAMNEIQDARDQLEKRVAERTAELAATNTALREEIAERRQAKARLSEQHAFLHNILESLTNPFYVIDAESYTIVLANEAAYALSDRSREGLTCYQLTHNQEKPCSGENHACALKMVKKTGEPVMVEHFHCGREGEGRYFEVYAYPIFDQEERVQQVIEYNVDITERRKAEEEKKKIWDQLLQSQKMEAVGILAGGVAHDFNNVLTAIIGNAHLAIVKGGDCRKRIGRYLEQIMKSSNRAVSLVRQLLIFSRQQGMEELDPLDLNWTIENILKMLKRLIGEDIEIKTVLAPDLWTIMADKVNIEQVITNLVVNARDAMPDGGEIIISTKNLGIDENLEKQIRNARLGNYVALSIADTGKGMPREDMEKIFEPFYTTKQSGQGTGLGLSIVRGVAEQHGGWVNVYSEEDKGTIFNMYLPAAAAEEPVAHEISGLKQPLSHGVFGKGFQVLLVEDEADVRNVSLNILESMGFSVLVAASCHEARQYLDSNIGGIDLLFSDVTLPDGKGVDLALDSLKHFPDLKVLMTSGYPDHRSRLSIIRERNMRFILKPYGLAELEQILWETLKTQAPPGSTEHPSPHGR